MNKREGKKHLEDLGEDERTYKMDLEETGWDSGDWSHLAEDRDKRWVQVNTPMHFRVARICGECLYQLKND